MKKFKKGDKESGEQFDGRINRYLTDKIIEDIDQIANLPQAEIKRILNQLIPEALEIIEEECQKSEKYEVCKIALELIEAKKENKLPS